MNKLDEAKKVIEEYYDKADCGIFDCRNIAGDSMSIIYQKDGLTIEICYHWAYFEVFGLTPTEFEELANFYYNLRRNEK